MCTYNLGTIRYVTYGCIASLPDVVYFPRRVGEIDLVHKCLFVSTRLALGKAQNASAIIERVGIWARLTSEGTRNLFCLKELATLLAKSAHFVNTEHVCCLRGHQP